MSRGRRYEEPKLNMKKVFAVIIAIVVVIMFIFMIKGLLTKDKDQGKIISKDYFTCFKDNKWGVIDSNGENIIDPSYAEMIIIPNSKNDIFLCTYDVDYQTGEYKTKALNSKNEEIFTNYDKIEAISNVDKNNNMWYEENILKVEKDGKFGLINLTGKELTSIDYEEISPIQGIKNALKVKKNGKYGIINDEGKEILKTQYADIDNIGKDDKSGFIIKSDNGKYGVVDYSENVVIEPIYDGMEKVYGNDYYVAKKANKQILVQKSGAEVKSFDYDEIKGISSNIDNGIIYTKNNKYGITKITGESVIAVTYEDLKEAKSGIFIAKKDGKYGIIDITNNIKTEFKYKAINYDEKADIYIAETEDFNNDIIDNTFYKKTYVQNQILGRALLESVLFYDGKCIFTTVTMDEMEFYGVTGRELGGIVEQLRLTDGVEVAIFLYQTGEEEYKVSLRSKKKIDVAAIATQFGGGGHVRAAGYTAKGSVYQIINSIGELIEKQYNAM